MVFSNAENRTVFFRSFIKIYIILFCVVSGLLLYMLFRKDSPATKIFKSAKGYFEIELPSNMTMVEKKVVFSEDGYSRGEVWFTFEKSDGSNPKGLVVIYGMPAIAGKGGACPGGYKKEMIQKQEVNVCEDGSFRVEYFIHPSRKIEYWIDTNGLDTGDLEIVKKAVKEKLRFI